MLIDLAGKSELDFPQDKYDVAVAGSGPAGISLALRLAEAGKKVALLEAGGLQFTPQSQAVYQTAEGTDPYFSATRLRFFGGTSNHWAGRCREPEPVDFEERPEAYEESGWPISFAEIKKYLAPAKAILDLESKEFKEKEGTQDLIDSFYPDLELLSPPTRFGVKYLDTLQTSKLIDLYVNANVVDIPLKEDLASIGSFAVKTFDNVSGNIQAKNYVIALGAVENARLLLNCDRQIDGGLGNGGGMLGTCFMDHVNVRLGKFIPDKDVWKDGINSMAYYTGDDFIRSAGIGASNVTMGYTAKAESDGRGQAVKKFLVERACNWGLEDQLSHVFQFVCPEEGRLSTLTEQDPYRKNRIYLSKEKDELGLRRVSVDWSLSDFDKKTIKAVAEEFAIQAHRGGVARVKLPEFLFEENVKLPFYGSGYLVNGHAHHMGATRMAESEKDGVVDPNCRVFGTNNLYVAGSSVFPRGGAHNPTMPLVQLALRLADHLIDDGSFPDQEGLSAEQELLQKT